MRDGLPGDAGLFESVANRLVSYGNPLGVQVHAYTTSSVGKIMADKVIRRREIAGPLLLKKCNLVTRGYLTSIHSVAVGQVQRRDRVVGQQLVASFEGGTRQIGVARIEKLEGLVERGLRQPLCRPQRRWVLVVHLIHRHRSASVDHHDSFHPTNVELVGLRETSKCGVGDEKG